MRIISTDTINSTSPVGKVIALEQQQLSKIVIGKDVLQLVSSGMYIDPMNVYREYVQNAADAVDVARIEGTLSPDEAGRVEISIDSTTRSIRIRDNGCGIPFEDFGRKLTALGASDKRDNSMRGFRGVGRLAGLAYARELVFRSRVPGEVRVSQLGWDCKKLKSRMRERSDRSSLTDVIGEVTSLERKLVDSAPERYFEVEMRGITRLRNDRLMSPSAISDFLSQVAPVPFSPDFDYGTEISRAVSPHTELGELEVRVGNNQEPIYKPHRNSIDAGAKRKLTFNGLQTIEVPSVDEGVGAVAWVLHHEYEGAIPVGTLVKGLRVRTGNIQVGGDGLLEGLFPESRFNGWAVGEVHVTDRRVVPNARRDHFEPNIHFYNLTNHLAPLAREVGRRCRTSSAVRKWERTFELQATFVAETIDILKQGSVGVAQREQLTASAQRALSRMIEIAQKNGLANNLMNRNSRIEALCGQLGELSNNHAVAMPLVNGIPEEHLELYQRFFELVYECSSNRSVAKALVDRILVRLGQSTLPHEIE